MANVTGRGERIWEVELDLDNNYVLKKEIQKK